MTYQRIINNFFFVIFRESKKSKFFVTNSKKTNKFFLLHIFVTWCNDRKLLILKMISTKIVAKNVANKIIYNNLYINIQNNSNHESLQFNIFRIENLTNDFKKIRIFIIDEIFIINSQMFNFVSKLFVKIHKIFFFFWKFSCYCVWRFIVIIFC